MVWSIRPAKAFDGKAARLAKKWRAEGACWLDLPPSPPSPVEFGRAKNMRKAGLKEHLKHPIWVSAHDDSHDEESIKPIISTDDVTPHVDDFAPIITFRVEKTKVYGVGQYDHARGCLYGLAVWEGNRWADVRKARGLKYPLTLVSVARIRGEAGVKFVCKDRADDNAYRTGAREGLPPTPAAAPASPEVQAAQQSLRSKAWETRMNAVDSLTRIGSESALTALAESLHGDRDVRVRLRAAFALAAIRTDAAVPPMIDALHCDRDPLVRMRAAFALGQVASGSAMPALADCLRRDKDPGVRRRAAEALKEVGGEQAIPALIQALKEPDAAVRRVVAHALGTLFQEGAGEENRDAAVGPLVQMLRRDPDTQVRRTVAWALRAVGGPKAVSALVEALRADKEPTVRQPV